MTQPLTLVLFDVDGTLIDSQAHIMLAMEGAFAAQGLVCPARADILSIVGLSLAEAFAVLTPTADDAQRTDLVESYKSAFANARTADAAALSPLYPGAADCLAQLSTDDDVVLGIATGKSRRGLDHVLALHSMEKTFVTEQVADFHPSKPNPAMALTAMAESGADRGVMIGDTTFDMDMGRAAGLKTIGVSWGYHDVETLRSRADVVVESYEELTDVLGTLWGE